MALKKAQTGSDIPEWLVTFADLMSILVCFFVLIISFSIQDEKKLQVVAGSMREAFGIVKVQQKAGVIERQGNPKRPFVKQISNETEPPSTDYSNINHDQNQKQGIEANTYSHEKTDIPQPDAFNLAAASLKQAWKDLPDITHVSDNLIVQDTEEGVNIVIADQEGHPMFPEASKYPYEATRKALAAMAPLLSKMPNQIRITGHTSAGIKFPNPRYGKWELSADRANVVRAILQEFGVPSDRIFSVAGRGDADPYFPNDPYLATNQRVSILLIKRKPPVPAGLAP